MSEPTYGSSEGLDDLEGPADGGADGVPGVQDGGADGAGPTPGRRVRPTVAPVAFREWPTAGARRWC